MPSSGDLVATYRVMDTLNTREKVIIAVFGPANAGKSTVIMELANRFPFNGKPVTIYSQSDDDGHVTDLVLKGDFTSKLTGKKASLGICSYGDDRQTLEKYFLPFVIENCDVIVVACHNLVEVDGNTYNFIDKVALNHNYRLLTTSILRDDYVRWEKEGLSSGHLAFHVNCVNINEIFADNMINLIKSIV